jgi:hypothetical protein
MASKVMTTNGRRHTPHILLSTIAVGLLARGALGSGRQPRLPRPLDTTRPITYFIADGRESTGFRDSDPQLALWALNAWRRSAGGRLRFEASSEPAALIRLYWAPPVGGQYGETEPLIVGGRRGAAVYIRPDMDALGPDIARRAREDALLRDAVVYLTCVHELGHALGLNHTAEYRDIMYFFGFGGDIVEYFGRYRRQLRVRNDIAEVSGLSDADLARVTALYSER